MTLYMGLDIEDEHADGTHLLRLSGELDMAAVPKLEGEIRRLCETPGTGAIALDLGGLCFIDSTGIAAIVLATRLCARQEIEFELLPGPRSVQRLFELTGLIDALPFRASAL